MMPLTGDVIEFCRGPVVVLHCLHASLCRHALPRWPHGTASEEERRPYPSVVIAFITLVYTTHLPSSSRLVRKVLPRALPFGILHRGKAVVDFGVEVVSPARPLETRDRVRVPWSMLSGQFSQDAAGDVYDSQWKRRKGSGFCGRCSLDNYSKTQLLTSMTPGVVDVTRCVLVESGSRRRHPLPRLYQDAAVDVDDSRSRRRQPLRLGRIWSRRRHPLRLDRIVRRASITELGPFPAFPVAWRDWCFHRQHERRLCMQDVGWKCSRQHFRHES